MTTSTEIESALRAVLPGLLHEHLAGLARLVADTAGKELAPAEAQARLAAEPAIASLLTALAGKAVDCGGTTLSFGAGNQFGTVTVGDVVGGHLIKINPTVIVQLANSGMVQPMPSGNRAAVLRMIEDYQSVFGGRAEELEALDEFLSQDDRRAALLLAPAGRGKTALLIRWLARVRAAAGWTVVFVPINRRYQTATAEVALGILAHGLAAFHGVTGPGPGAPPHELRDTVAESLRREPPEGKRLLLILDGLDEAVGWSVGRDLFPRTLPPTLRMVASARQMADKTWDDWVEELGWQSSRAVAVSLAELRAEDVAEVLRQLGRPGDARPADASLVGEVLRVSQGDPLTVRLLAEAIRDGSLSPGALTRLPPGLKAYVRAWLEELEEQGARSAAVQTFLGLCATALGPLATADFQGLAPEIFGQRMDLRRAAKAVARFISGDGSEGDGYVFSHPRLRELFREMEFTPQERSGLQDRFVHYGEQWFAVPAGPPTAYLRRFWVAHLADAGRWDTVRTVLTVVLLAGAGGRQPWADARSGAEGAFSGYLGDLDVLWRRAEEQDDLALGLRCALLASSARSLSGGLSPGLLLGLAKVGTPAGRWPLGATLEHVRQMPEPSRQAQALRSLLKSGLAVPMDLVLEVARGIPDALSRAGILGELAPFLNGRAAADVSAEAVAAVAGVRAPEPRARGLAALAACLPPDQQAGVYARALEACAAIVDAEARAAVLAKLAPSLPEGLLARALVLARTLNEGRHRARALEALAHYLPGELLPDAVAGALTIREHDYRAAALAALAPQLPADLLAHVHATAAAAVHAVRDGWPRWRALEVLAPYLPEPLVPQALAGARSITDEWYRAKVLVVLADRLPASRRPVVFAEAIVAASGIASPQMRAVALRDMASFLPADQRAGIYAAALEAVAALGEHEAVDTLEMLIPSLPEELLARALAAVRTFGDVGWRSHLLVKLAPRLPEALLLEVLSAVRAPGEDIHRALVLSALAPRLPESLLAEALAGAAALNDGESRSLALEALASRLPASLLTKALDLARTITEGRHRAGALEALVPHLPAGQQAAVYAEAFAAARTIGDDRARAQTLATLALHLQAGQQAAVYAEALAAARTIAEDSARAHALAALASYLPAGQQAGVCAEALAAARAVADDEARALALAAVAPGLRASEQAGVYGEILTLARGRSRPCEQAQNLEAILPRVPDSMLAEILDTAAVGDEARALAPGLRASEQAGVCGEVLTLARGRSQPWEQARNLEAILPCLPESMLAQVLDAAAVMDWHDRSRILAALAPRVPQPLLPQFLAAARGITSTPERVSVLLALAARLPLNRQRKVHAEALRHARALDNPTSRAGVLTDLIPHLPEDKRPAVCAEALAAAAEIGEALGRTRALLSLGPYLAPPRLLDVSTEALAALAPEDDITLELLAVHAPEALLPDVLAAAQRLDEFDRSRILVALAPRLPAALLSPALDAARTMATEGFQTPALVALAPRLPEHLLGETLRVATSLGSEGYQTSVLAALAPHLAAHVHGTAKGTRGEGTDWPRTLRTLAAQGRQRLLSGLGALLPWLARLAKPETLSELFAAIRDVTRCWP